MAIGKWVQVWMRSGISLCCIYGYELMIETKGVCVKVTVGLDPGLITSRKRDWWAGRRWLGKVDKMGLGLNVGWQVAYLGIMV